MILLYALIASHSLSFLQKIFNTLDNKMIEYFNLQSSKGQTINSTLITLLMIGPDLEAKTE